MPMSIDKYIRWCRSIIMPAKNFRPELNFRVGHTVRLITLKAYKLHLISFVKGKIIWQRQSSSSGSLFVQNGCIRKLWLSSCPVHWCDSRCVSLWMDIINNLLKSDTIVSDRCSFPRQHFDGPLLFPCWWILSYVILNNSVKPYPVNWHIS